MIEIKESELRMDEKSLKYATDEEINEFRLLAGSISNRIKNKEQSENTES